MQDEHDPKHTFLNRRDWGSYLSALQSVATYPKATYPKMIEAVKSSSAWFAEGATQASTWFTEGATQASNWLADSVKLRDKFSVG